MSKARAAKSTASGAPPSATAAPSSAPGGWPVCAREAPVADDALALIGGTPLVRLARVSPEGGGVVHGKLESRNPGGSVKDRPALAMIAARRAGGAAPAWRDDRRGHERQHRHQPGDDRRGARLSLRAGHARGHEPRAPLHPARLRRRNRADPGRTTA